MVKLTLLEKHIEFKKTSVHSIDKQKDIERYLKKFILFHKKDIEKINENDLTRFINSLTGKYSIATINTIKAYIKDFIKNNFNDWSSRFPKLDKICRGQKTSRTYEPEQMKSIEDLEKLVNGEKDLMWKVFWLVFFYGGFRPSECCNLEWDKNIFFEKEGTIIKVKATKTGKDFYKSLPKNAEHLLKEWRKYNDSKYVFPSPIKKDCPIISRSVRARLVRLSQRVLGEKVVPYQLRHSIATILYGDDKRKDDDTANQLGHTKSMKAVYMNLDEDKLKAKARKLWIKTKPLTPEERDKLEELERELEKLRKNSVSKKDVMRMVQQALMKTAGQIKVKI